MEGIRKKLAAWLVSLLAAPVCWAEPPLATLPLEDLLGVGVESASRFSQPLAEAPSAVTVISAEDIRRYGFRDPGEALQMAPGVYSTNDGDYTFLGVRGFGRPGDYNSRILFLTDGQRRNDPIYNQAMVGSEAAIDRGWIKQLEFVPGPASALYGGNALFGVANAVLWSGAEVDGSRVSTGLGSAGRAHLSLLSGRATEAGGDWVMGLALDQKAGENPHFAAFDRPGVSDGIARNLDGERSMKWFGRLQMDGWRLSANFYSRYKSVPTAYFGTQFNTAGNFTDDRGAYLDLSNTRDLAADWSRFLRLYGGSYEFTGEYVYSGYRNRDEARSTWWGLEYRLSYSGFDGHRLMFGLEGESAPKLVQRNYDLAPRQDYLNDRRSGGGLGVFIEDEWRIAPRWMANLGLRLDHLRGFETMVSPRTALIFFPRAETTVKLVYGRAFRPPNVYERYYNDGNISQKANPQLKSERISSTELILEHSLRPGLQVGGSFYHYRLDHLVDQTLDGGLMTFINSPPTHAHGLELQTEAVLAGNFKLKASLAWQRVRQHDGDPVNSPQRLGKLFMDGPLFGSPWTLGLNLQAIGQRRTMADRVPGYVRSGLTLRRPLTDKGSEISLSIHNLAGKHYLDPAAADLRQDALPSDGRQLMLRWDFAL